MSDTVPDTVLIQVSDAPPSRVPVGDYLKMPVEQQVELLLRGRVSFFQGEQSLDTKAALKQLRKLKASAR